MKPIKIVQRNEEGGGGRIMEGVNPMKIYCKLVCRYHNIFPFATSIC
jgi:hypothetical protein